MGRALVSFVVAMMAVLAVVVGGVVPSVMASTATELGAIAVTLFGATGMLCAYRGAVARDPVAGLIASAMFVLGAMWSWLAFIDSSAVDERIAAFVSVVGATAAVVLLVRGFRSARWLEVFSGLGLLAVALSAGFFRAAAGSAASVSAVALLVALAGMICLYGLLVDIEVAEHRSLQQMLAAREQLQVASRRNAELLHDLRSGLLAIEAASSGSAAGNVEPVRCEAARLRQLTVVGSRDPARFDFVSGVAGLVAAKRAAGVNVVFDAPASVLVEGDESELLSVVENLLSNAQRHGRDPIVVRIEEQGSNLRLAVSDAGDGVLPSDAEQVFRRGFSSHPDGSGIGLSRARLLAGRNGAALELEAASSAGPTFALTMRLAIGVGAS